MGAAAPAPPARAPRCCWPGSADPPRASSALRGASPSRVRRELVEGAGTHSKPADTRRSVGPLGRDASEECLLAGQCGRIRAVSCASRGNARTTAPRRSVSRASRPPRSGMSAVRLPPAGVRIPAVGGARLNFPRGRRSPADRRLPSSGAAASGGVRLPRVGVRLPRAGARYSFPGRGCGPQGVAALRVGGAASGGRGGSPRRGARLPRSAARLPAGGAAPPGGLRPGPGTNPALLPFSRPRPQPPTLHLAGNSPVWTGELPAKWRVRVGRRG